MSPNESLKKDTYYKCKKCGDEIYWNTRRKYTACKCGALAVDGCEDYVRLIGNEKDWEVTEHSPVC